MEFVAFTKNNYVFSRNSGYVGTFEEGFFRDKTGHVVTFVGNARGDASAHATPATPAIPATPALPAASWSNVGWHEFLS